MNRNTCNTSVRRTKLKAVVLPCANKARLSERPLACYVLAEDFEAPNLRFERLVCPPEGSLLSQRKHPTDKHTKTNDHVSIMSLRSTRRIGNRTSVDMPAAKVCVNSCRMILARVFPVASTGLLVSSPAEFRCPFIQAPTLALFPGCRESQYAVCSSLVRRQKAVHRSRVAAPST